MDDDIYDVIPMKAIMHLRRWIGDIYYTATNVPDCHGDYQLRIHVN